MEIVNYISFAIGAFGSILIVWGALVSAFRLCANEIRKLNKKVSPHNGEDIRHFLSFYLLMGLEYMIGADIIRTLIRPTLDELIILGSMVAIRTVISFFLNKEMKRAS